MKKILFRTIVIAVSLIFISAPGFAADQKAPVKPTVEKKADKKAETKTALIDINTATKAELSALTGIGDIYSQEIIDGRPYARKDQLKSRKIISGATYDRIKDKIIAKQPPKKK
jgi:competence protein ComEA